MNIIENAYRRFSERRFPLPSEDQVAALERQMHAPLPADFRRFILEYNGGIFNEPDITPTTEDCPDDRLTVLNGIGADYHGDVLGADVSLFDGNDPVLILPIGYTLMGNLLVVFIGDDDDGYIYMKKAGADNFYELAENIEGFFSLLTEP